MLASIVVPAYNEKERIGATLGELSGCLRDLGVEFEIIVADDGSSDGTAERVDGLGIPGIQLCRLPQNRGKGEALRRGVMRARGDPVFFVDADLPYGLEFFPAALRILAQGQAGAVIGARDLPGSSSDPSYPQLRVRGGKLFSHLVNRVIPVRVFDTQCGIKAFRADVLQRAIGFTQQTDYTLDIELLLLLRLWGVGLEKLPVRLVRHHGSKVRLLRDSARMLRSLLEIARNYRRGLYPAVLPETGLQFVPCPLCRGDRNRVYAVVEGQIRFCRCLHCRTLYQNPRLEDRLVHNQYDSRYFASPSIYSGYTGYWATLEHQRRTAQWLWNQIERVSGGTVRTALDVGCGSGEFVREGLSRNVECWGNDVFSELPEPDLHFVKGDFTEVELPCRFFDLVVFNDSFEHFPDPRKPLERCRELLRPGGHLMINLPDPDSWLARISGRTWISLKREHLVICPRRALAEILTSHSFSWLCRIASRQYADWDYLKPRLRSLSPALSRLAGPFLSSRRGATLRAPTGGMLVFARLDSTPSSGE